MFNNKAQLKQQANDTAEVLSLKVRELENRISDTAEKARESVTEVIDSVKNTVHSLSPIEQIKNNPLPFVGAAVLTGFASTFWLRGLWKPAALLVAREFGGELQAVKKVGMGIAVNLISKKLQSKFPDLDTAPMPKEVQETVH